MKRLLALLLAGAFAVGGCADDKTSNAPTTKVTVVLDWTPNTNHSGLYLARAEGLYTKAGIELDIIEPDQSGAMAQVAAGNADFGYSVAEAVIPARANGSPVVSIATVMRTNASSLLAPADRGIHRPRDLEGKTYGTFGGEIERALIETLVRCDGGDPSKVKYIDVGNVDFSVGFDRGQYDFVWVFDGWDTIRMAELQGRDVTTVAFRDYTQCIPDWYTPVLVATDAMLAKQPDLVRRFLAATTEGYRRAAADPAAAAKAIKDGAPESDMALLDPSARFLAPFLTDSRGGWGFQDPEMWTRFNRFLADSGMVNLNDVGTAYTNEFVPDP